MEKFFKKTDSEEEILKKPSTGQKVVSKTKKILKSIKETTEENTKQFCQNTSLHGLKFVGNSTLALLERSFFFVAFIIALVVTINFISNIYSKWTTTPVIVGINPIQTFINEIPFPAVTICNMNQARKSKVFGINNKSVEYSILQTLCARDAELSAEAVNATNDWSIFSRFIVDISQPCDVMLLSCKFGSKKYNCNEIFRSVLTDEGYCCTFNALSKKFMYKVEGENNTNVHENDIKQSDIVPIKWTPEQGYPKDLPSEVYPFKGAGIGSSLGLSLILNASIDEYFCSSTFSAGFKILLHNPCSIPNIAEFGLAVEVGQEARIIIRPAKVDSSPNLRGIKQKYRSCLYSSESNLTYFSTYTRKNCHMECEVRYMAKECGCIQYYMPRVIPKIRLCGLKDITCFEKVKIALQNTDENFYSCNSQCPPGCFELSYSPEIYTNPIVQGNFRIQKDWIRNLSAGYAKNNLAIVDIFFTESVFRSTFQEQFIGLTEFLSSTGGLMGLFLGFSVVAAIEVFYYSTLRPYFAYRKQKTTVEPLPESEIMNLDGNESETPIIKILEEFSTQGFKQSLGFDLMSKKF